MSEKHRPDSHAPDEPVDIETLRLQAVVDVSNGNERILPVPPVAAGDEDSDTTIKRAAIKHRTQNVPGSNSPLSAKPAGSELKESGTQYEVPYVEQLEFPPTNDPFQVEISLFDTLNLPIAPAEAEVSLVDTLAMPTIPATVPFTGKLPDTPDKVDMTSPIQEHMSHHKSHEQYEASQHINHSIKDMVHQPLILALTYPLKYPLRLWGFSPTLFVLVLLVPLLGSGLLAYTQLNQTRDSMYRVNLPTGTTQWQHMITTPTRTAMVDSQGSLLTASTGGQQHQLEAFDRNGILQWHTFTSTETFSLPLTSSPAGTVLMILSNVSSTSSQASNRNSTIYLSPLSFYLLRRATGQTIWHKTLVEVQQQQAVILGTDNQFIFVALTEIASSLPKTTQGTKLLALDQATGNIAWQIFAPIPHNLHLYDGGKLLVQQHHVIWQVAGSVYVIATPPGTIQWQKSITEDRPEILLQEEAQMVEVAGLLVVQRSDVYHALDITSGHERWLLVNPAGDALSLNNIALAVVGRTLLIYGVGGIQAFDVTDQHILWSQKQLNSIQNLNPSEDGKLIYTTVTNSIEDSAPAQALVAIDSGNGAVHWTFQPTAHATFLPLGSSGILYRRSILLTAVCTSSPQQNCTHVIIYALDATTGRIIWKYEGNSIDDMHISADASIIEFQSNSSPWQDLLGHFRS